MWMWEAIDIEYLVLSGINEGDLIITEGQQKVCENTPVTIK